MALIPDVAVVGGGLAGALLALELACLDQRVLLLDDLAQSHLCASQWSYGAIAPLAGQRWQQLQRQHGDLGWRRAWFRPLGPGAFLGGCLPLPCSRVRADILQLQLPLALERAGVERLPVRVDRLIPPAGDQRPWRLQLRHQAEPLVVRQVVLAAGAGCRALWPELPTSLRVSWAGVLLLQPQPGGWPWEGPAAMRLPGLFTRLDLEARAASLSQEAWQVDPGMLPWGQRWLAGQISLVRPGLVAGAPPDAGLQERRLRQALTPIYPDMAHWPADFQQVPVSFCTDGQPLVGPVTGVTGLWVFAGFSSAFTAIPVIAPVMAQAIAQRQA
jgi:glycine/D-amino acid oxidase-like deaminating enzyme